ncbi:kappa-type opioid receptor-like, partial [Anneissia japonica]|uniref:kappa-type opioid receptor-like n=1 Tax=Anneissia japonica TaxID=1529436 RepID=UPI00142590F3
MDIPRNGTAHIKLQDPLVLVVARWVLASVSIIANSLVIFVFVYNKTYKKSLSLKLLLHQAVIDLTGSLMFLVFYNIDVPDGTGGTIFCKMGSLLAYISLASAYNFVTITVERYIAVVHPIIYRQRSLGGKMKYLSFSIPYVCSAVLTVVHTISIDVDANIAACIVKEFNAVAEVLLIIADWLIPISIMLYCYVRMLLKLHKTRVVSQQPSSEVPTSNGRRY